MSDNASIADQLDALHAMKNADAVVVLGEAADRLRKQNAVRFAAEALFNRCTYTVISDVASAYAELHLAVYLGTALYGEDDPRVQALRPKPKFKFGDWVVCTQYGYDHGAMLVTAVRPGGEMELQPRQDFPALGPQAKRYWVGVSHPSHVRLATADEIKAARGE